MLVISVHMRDELLVEYYLVHVSKDDGKDTAKNIFV